MAAYCVVYDLHAPGQRYEKVDEAMKALGGGKAFNTTWFLASSTMTAERIYAAIAPLLDANDKLIVFLASSPANWKGLPSEWTTWLKNNL